MEIDQSKVQSPKYLNKELNWYGCNLNKLADRFGTPLHVGCSEAVSDSVASFRKPFEKAGLPISLYYSVKTNPLPVFLDRVHKSKCGFEIVSTHEANLLDSLNIPPGKIISTGIPEEFESEKNFRLITVSTLNHLQKITAQNPEEGDPLRVGITIRPNLWRAYWDITLNTSQKNGWLGVSPDSDQFDELLAFISKNPGLELAGLHMHLGSGIRSAAPYRKGIKAMEKAAIKAADMGMKIEILDIGGGFGLRSAPMLKVRNVVSSLLGFTNNNKKESNSSSILEPIADQLAATLGKVKRQGIEISEIAAEPGRVLSGPCQLIILTIKEVISRNSNQYLICDSGAMSLSPMLLTERHRILALSDKPGEKIQYEVHGPLPSALDRVSASAPLPQMKAKERIVVLDAGAYFLSMNNTFNGPRPSVVWIENRKVKLARRRETEQDLNARDMIPGKLWRRSH